MCYIGKKLESLDRTIYNNRKKIQKWIIL